MNKTFEIFLIANGLVLITIAFLVAILLPEDLVMQLSPLLHLMCFVGGSFLGVMIYSIISQLLER